MNGIFLSGDYGMLIEIITEYTLWYFLNHPFRWGLLGSNQPRWGKSGSKYRWDDQQLPGAMIVEGHVPRGGLRNSG